MARTRRSAAGGVPDKAHINLVVPDEDASSPVAVVVTALLLAVLVAAFAKFGVVDVLASVGERQGELTRAQDELARLQGQLSDYDSLKRRYESYEAISLVEANGRAGAPEALELVEDVVMPAMRVTALSFEDAMVRLELLGTSLEQVGALARTLESRSAVASATVESASAAESAEGVRAVISVTLRQEEGREGEADQ